MRPILRECRTSMGVPSCISHVLPTSSDDLALVHLALAFSPCLPADVTVNVCPSVLGIARVLLFSEMVNVFFRSVGRSFR